MVSRGTYFFSASFFGGGAGVTIIGAGAQRARGAFSSLESFLPQANAVLARKVIINITNTQRAKVSVLILASIQ